MDEVEYSNVTKTESRRGCGLGCGGHRLGDIPASFPEGVRYKEGFYRAKIIINDINQEEKSEIFQGNEVLDTHKLPDK